MWRSTLGRTDKNPLTWVSSFISPRKSYTTRKQSSHVCIIGSGPAGFYTVETLLSTLPNCQIDIYEKFPAPYGLVRYGVAPDHPEMKVITKKFEILATNPQVTFTGNVEIGKHITVSELLRHYHAVVLAYGAGDERKLNIPGEELKGVHSARKFVGWYNGDPSMSKQEYDFSQVDTAMVIGQGNVALDVARLLLRTNPNKDLKDTDIILPAIKVLEESKIKNVHIIGRRGPVQASFTNKELREILYLDNVDVNIQPENIFEDGFLPKEDITEMEKERAKKRMIALMKKKNGRKKNNNPTSMNKNLVLHYLKTPVRVIGSSDGKVTGIELEKNILSGEAGNRKAVGTGVKEVIQCGVIFTSIGYKSLPIGADVPFDTEKGLIPNQNGRVKEGLYVSGWVKRGPSGIIGTNKYDAEETVASIVQDLESERTKSNFNEKEGRKQALEILKSRGAHPVSWGEWKYLDEEELNRGKKIGKGEREKIRELDEMMSILDKVRN